jgi:HNH endonuclease
MGRFKPDDVERLLVACHRCCCICHRFCGVKMEIDHIVQQAEDGPDTYENAVPVCFECHAEIHSYNDKHPRGRKFQPTELRGHRDQWFSICRDRPEIFLHGSNRATVGPLQSLVDELEFNAALASAPAGQDQFCPFRDEQFLEAISSGSIAMLRDELRHSVIEAYAQIGRANQLILALTNAHHPAMLAEFQQRALGNISRAKLPIQRAREELLKFLGRET